MNTVKVSTTIFPQRRNTSRGNGLRLCWVITAGSHKGKLREVQEKLRGKMYFERIKCFTFILHSVKLRNIQTNFCTFIYFDIFNFTLNKSKETSTTAFSISVYNVMII